MDGLLGFIVPSMFAHREYGAGLRRVIAGSASVVHVVDFGSNRVFTGPMNYVAIYILSKGPKQKPARIMRFERPGESSQGIQGALLGRITDSVSVFDATPQTFAGNAPWRLVGGREKELLSKAKSLGSPLSELVLHASEGIHSGKDSVFYLAAQEALELGLETPPTFALAKGKDIHRYRWIHEGCLSTKVIYPYDLSSGDVLDEAMLSEESPHVWEYLVGSRQSLRGRPYFDRSSKKWYELWCPREPELFLSPKIIGPEIAKRGEFTLARDPLFFNNKVKGVVLKDGADLSLEQLLGILNSSLLHFLHRLLAAPKGGGFFEVKTRTMGELPIAPRSGNEQVFEELDALVISMLGLNKDRDNTKIQHDRKLIQRQIDATDKQIDQLVYELYGLTDEEIRIVEEATK